MIVKILVNFAIPFLLGIGTTLLLQTFLQRREDRAARLLRQANIQSASLGDLQRALENKKREEGIYR